MHLLRIQNNGTKNHLPTFSHCLEGYAAIHFGLKLFKSELAGCPDWDFDMKYQLWGSIDTFERLLKQIEQVQP